MQRAFFPKDDTLFDIMKSDEFKKLLATDASTNEGQDFIAAYYGIDNWVQLQENLREFPSLYQPFGTPIWEVPRGLWSLRPNASRSDIEV